MIKYKSIFFWYSFLLSFIILYPINAYAYIDPMSGSIVLQALIAGFVGCVIYVKASWLKLKGFFFKLIHRNGFKKNKTK